jgi:Uma2 family endonuclease
MATVERVRTSGQRFFLPGVGWDAYDTLLRAVGDRHIRMNYAKGDLELVTPLFPHERYSKLLGRLIETLTVEMGIEATNAGSMTLRREELDRGLEPDECFYIQNEHVIRDRPIIDLSIDPPPDLAIEIDITSSSIDRQEIYARLGVPELWRFDGETLQVLRLEPSGVYQPCPRSAIFPFLPIERLPEFLNPTPPKGNNAITLEFAAWVRNLIPPST